MKYHLARGEEQLGTFNDLDVSAGLREGRFKPSDLCWTEGMAEWQPLSSHLQELNPEPGPLSAVLPAIEALRAEIRQDQGLRIELASRGQRLTAKLIDNLLLLVPFMVIFSILFDTTFVEEFRALQNDPTALMNAMQRRFDKIQESGNLTPSIMGLILDAVLIANVILLTRRGQTIGKLIMRIEIVRFPGGARAGFVKAVMLRGLLFVIVGFFGFVGLLLLLADALMIFRKDRRCMHDLVADTMVAKRNG